MSCVGNWKRLKEKKRNHKERRGRRERQEKRQRREEEVKVMIVTLKMIVTTGVGEERKGSITTLLIPDPPMRMSGWSLIRQRGKKNIPEKKREGIIEIQKETIDFLRI